MCILMYYSPSAMPIVSHLENGAANNPDGFGWAIVHEDIILTGHSMDSDSAIAEFVEMRNRYPDGAALFHSRITTHGGSTLANCHPFRVGGNRADMVVAHNGIIDRCSMGVKGDDRSDTRRFAEDVVPRRFMHLDSPKTRRKLEAFIGSGSKVVILTTNPTHKSQSYIFNEQAGVWIDDTDGHDGPGDIWYSNTSYLSSYYRGFGGGYGTGWAWNASKGVGYREGGDTFQGLTGVNYVRVCEQCFCRLWVCDCVGYTATMWVPEHEVATVIGTPMALTAAQTERIVESRDLSDDKVWNEVITELRGEINNALGDTLTGSEGETDDPETWLCRVCGVRGSIDQETVSCKRCGGMYCCDSPADQCQCWPGR